MKYSQILAWAMLAMILAGCETVSQRDRQVLQTHNVSQDVYDKMLYGTPLAIGDVIELSHRAVPPGLIIHYMDETNSVYVLRKPNVERLRTAGVNEQVIGYMLSTGRYYSSAMYRSYSYGGPYPYAYSPYDGYYGGPYFGPVVFVGGGYYHHWGGGWGGRGRRR